MPYVLPSVDEFEVSWTSLLRLKFFVWIISGSETILGTVDVEFGPRLFVRYREKSVKWFNSGKFRFNWTGLN